MEISRFTLTNSNPDILQPDGVATSRVSNGILLLSVYRYTVKKKCKISRLKQPWMPVYRKNSPEYRYTAGKNPLAVCTGKNCINYSYTVNKKYNCQCQDVKHLNAGVWNQNWNRKFIVRKKYNHGYYIKNK